MLHARNPGTHLDVDGLLGLRAEAASSRIVLASSDSRTGGLAGRKRGQGSDLRELRLYAEGDDLRHVDAMASARSGRMHVRTFHEDQDKTILLVADFRPPMLWGTRRRLRSVAAGEALAIAGWQAVLNGGKVGLLAVNAVHAYHVMPQARDKAMMRVAGALARAHDEAWNAAHERHPARRADMLATVLERAARLAPTGSTVFCATGLDEPGDDFTDVAGSFARRANLTFLLVRDGIEAASKVASLPYIPFGAAPGRTPVWGRPATAEHDDRLDLVPPLANVCLIDATAERAGALFQFGSAA